MRISELENLGFKCVVPAEGEIFHGYVGDLLSEVMAHVESESVWLTIQSHVNIVAVAVVTGIKAIILCGGYEFDSETLEKAKEEKVGLFSTRMSSFESAGKLYETGLR
jgi:predicted transcriptional regulator